MIKAALNKASASNHQKMDVEGEKDEDKGKDEDEDTAEEVSSSVAILAQQAQSARLLVNDKRSGCRA